MVRIAVLLFLAAVLAACATPETGCGQILQPPTAFDHFPGTTLRIMQAAYDDVQRECRDLGSPNAGFECVSIGMGPPIIVVAALDQRVTLTIQNCEIHHALGHINGWPVTHPNAR